jgi:hypothetical protein
MKDAALTLLSEIPLQTVVWHTTGRTYTAEDLIKEVKKGTDIGKQWQSDLFRVSRDILARQASRTTDNSVQILDFGINKDQVSATLLVEKNKIPAYGVVFFKYTVITRKTSRKFHMLDSLWDANPKWKVFVRSDCLIEDRGVKRYLGCGGTKKDIALREVSKVIAEHSNVKEAIGAESTVPIDMLKDKND